MLNPLGNIDNGLLPSKCPIHPRNPPEVDSLINPRRSIQSASSAFYSLSNVENSLPKVAESGIVVSEINYRKKLLETVQGAQGDHLHERIRRWRLMGRRIVYLIAAAILLISVAIIRADLPAWDVNGDGVIDFSDLVLASRHFGETGVGVTGDVNADGTVNILDLILICCHFGESSHEGEDEAVTVVELTDTVLVADTMRFGVNLGSDDYWGSTFVKKRTQVNFEGTSYRQCHYGPTPQDEYGATSWFRQPDWWVDLMREHGYYTILSGPARGTTGKIAGISTRMHEHKGTMKEFMYIEFDRTVEPGPPNGGLLVEAFRLEDGQFLSGNLGIFWTFLNSEIAIGDVPPGSFGHAALCMKGTTDPAHVSFSTHYH